MVVVLPVFNEADSIGAVLAEVEEAAARLERGGVRTTVVVVDDESPDGTGASAVAACHQLGLDLELIVGQREGLGSAMLRGLQAALTLGPTAIVTLDGDGQHNPSDIPTLYRAFLARGADIAIGSRWTRGGRAPGTSAARAFGSRVGNWVFRGISGTRGVKDATTSFRVYSPEVASFLLRIESNRYSGYSFFSTTIALAEAAGFSITEVPITFRPRYSGLSKLNRREVRRYFASLPALREERRRLVVTNGEGTYRAAEEAELLSRAANWNRFVLDAATAGVRTDAPTVLEVGAGRGGITAQLRERFPRSTVIALEPDAANFEVLADRFADDPSVRPLAARLGDLTGEFAETPHIDVVLYVNVLEHIADDVAELRLAAERLAPGGTLGIVVPGMPSLYAPIDAKSGHYRRYTVAMLRAVVEAAGFESVDVGYSERLGVVPYYVAFRLLNRSGMESGASNLFDRVYVPTMRRVEPALRWLPFGKNVVCTARKPVPHEQLP